MAIINFGLAKAADRPLLQMSEIASKEDFPVAFLEQILMQLKAEGYIESRRGQHGGYLLARPLENICIGQVIRTCPSEEHCGLRMLMLDVRSAIANNRIHYPEKYVPIDLWFLLHLVDRLTIFTCQTFHGCLRAKCRRGIKSRDSEIAEWSDEYTNFRHGSTQFSGKRAAEKTLCLNLWRPSPHNSGAEVHIFQTSGNTRGKSEAPRNPSLFYIILIV